MCRLGNEECILSPDLSTRRNAASYSIAGCRVVGEWKWESRMSRLMRAHAPRALSCCRGESKLGGISEGVMSITWSVTLSYTVARQLKTSRINTSQVNLFRWSFASIVCCCLFAKLPPRPSQLERCDCQYTSNRRAASIAPVGREPPKHALDRSAGVRRSISMRPLTKLIDLSSRLFEDDSHSVVEIRTDSLSTLRELGPPDLVHLVKQPVKSTNKQVIEHPWAKETISGIQTATRSVC